MALELFTLKSLIDLSNRIAFQFTMAFLQCDFFSETLRISSSMNVILPQAPHEVKAKPFPYLLLLHGLSDDHTSWMRKTSIERYACEKGLAVVMPAANRSFYTNMFDGPAYWDFISNELPEISERFFPLSNKREDKFVGGLSMGGYGAIKMGLSKPRNYAAAISLSGALDLRVRPDDWEKRLPEWKRIFGPNDALQNRDDDLFALAKRHSRTSLKDELKLYIACGTEDQLYPSNASFRACLKQCHIDFTYEEGPGEHNWKYWDQQIQHALRWLPLAPTEINYR